MATTPIGNSSSTNSTNDTTNKTSSAALLGGLKLDDFLTMLLTELQNQDPLSPMDSSQLLTQIGQISQVGATQGLTDTLDAVRLGQSLNNATALIGKKINGLADDGTDVTGKVDKVTVANGQPVLNVGEKTVQLKNVRSVLPADADATKQAAAQAAEDSAADTQSLQQLLEQLKMLQKYQEAQQAQAVEGAAATA